LRRHSFPTRRSSDLIKSLLAEALEEIDLERNPPPPDPSDVYRDSLEAE
jgi:hypothetical protein